MNAPEAARLLNLPPDAPYAECEARFLELRAKLEEKIGQAPTPGLKEKYRASLAEVTTAFETLTLLNDSSALPVLKKPGPETGTAAAARPAADSSPGAGPVPPPRPTATKPAAKKHPSQNREFIIVSIIAALVMLIGGWWVYNARTRHEEARRQAEADAQRATELARVEKQVAEDAKLALAAAEKAEHERAERRNAQARTRLTELNLALESALRVERTAERELSDLQGDFSSDRTNAGLAKRVKAQTLYVRWVRDHLADHPVKAAKSLAESAISNRAPDAPALLEKYAEGIEALKQELKDNQADPEMVATLEAQKKMAEQGDVVAMNWVSYAYFDAEGIPHDEALGVEWARKAAAKGSASSMTRLGSAYRTGRGVPKDEKIGLEWWIKAAERGEEGYLYSIGWAYEHGSGAEKNPDIAMDWYKRAADKGDVSAMSELGVLLLNKSDRDAGLRWLNAAAAKDHVYSLRYLAGLYLGEIKIAGLDLAPDEAAALDLLRKAARLGDADVRRQLQKRNLTW